MELTQLSPARDKLARFLELFRGRTDVYPRRFESRRTGKSGYQPACGNEWVRGVCEKPRIRCSECPHQRWLPVTAETARWHLEGHGPTGAPFVMGVYPMLPDEKCHFLAIDLDGEGWREDARALAGHCKSIDVPFGLERSRSGDGAHLWLFFSEAVPAALARNLGTHVLTEAIESRPEIGLASYDRLFPNQDTLPVGGFGNLIALPLQREPRSRGHSVFLDEMLNPFADQWAFLGGIGKLDRATVEAIVGRAGKSGRILAVQAVPDDEFAFEPWRSRPSKMPPLPSNAPPGVPFAIHVVLADQIYVSKTDLSAALRSRLLRIAAFQNPEFYRAQAMRLPTYDKPRVIGCAEEHPAHIALPRGCLDEVLTCLAAFGAKPDISDKREGGTTADFTFHGELRPDQTKAANSLLRHDTGVLAATTAFGKTVLAAWMIAKRGVNTLVLVHRQQLMDQWVERLTQFLGLPAKSVGRLGGGRRKLTGVLDVALIQSLVKSDAADERIAAYGHLIVDECHHLPARSFEVVARSSKARYVLGLSATVGRKDGHHPIIFMQCGPLRYRVDAKSQALERGFEHNVIVRPTGFESARPPADDKRAEFTAAMAELVADERRNEMICADVVSLVAEKRNPLVLTERKDHAEALAALLRTSLPGTPVILLLGGMGKKAFAEALATLASQDRRVVVATGKLIGEGFDDPVLDTLFMAMPVSWRGTIAQYVGRLHRIREGKHEVRVYDYADLNHSMLARMFDRRCAGYEAVGYRILMPASALPGWPHEVPLPVSAEWKNDYAASVRRLLRDGVGTTLARAFLRATSEWEHEKKRPDGSRSAVESFFNQRLHTWQRTRGLFAMNAELPIPFGAADRMEIDFLDARNRMAIEIDGAQHLADANAWRRDRCKDQLLQRRGYLVLRFLAEDVVKQLDLVLDTVAAALDERAAAQEPH